MDTILMAYDYLKNTAPKIYTALQLMRRHSALGKYLVDWAECHEIQIVEKDIKPFGQCLYNDTNAWIELNSKNNVNLHISTLAHELMHALQTVRWGRLRTDYCLDLTARILKNRAVEAAAETCSLKVCYEMKQHGYKGAFYYRPEKRNGHNILRKIFENSYDLAYHKEKNNALAIQQACDDAFHAYYKVQPLINTYNLQVLEKYLTQLIEKEIQDIPAQTAFGETTSHGLTQIGENDFLVSKITPDVSDQGLYGNNTKMRQAFEFIEFYRLFLLHNKSQTNFGVQRALLTLEQDNNPYINKISDLLKIIDDLEENRSNNRSTHILKVMDKISGISRTAAQQLSLDFSNSAKRNRDQITTAQKSNPHTKTTANDNGEQSSPKQNLNHKPRI
jgi:hypothetical protein